MKNPSPENEKNLLQLYSLASEPFLADEFDDSPEANREFLRLLGLARKGGIRFAGISFFEDDCPLCVLEMKRIVYEHLAPRYEASEKSALH